ncbi:hypothetical protein [Amycolatopsis sp. NPDC052450]|uniref:hypothetical protein n=1 Tax=Amycolatopsis sp. NPDC052450 TaxID=3363937 RepID=UPI0037CC3833
MSRSISASPEARRARGKLAAATRDHGAEHPITCAARREFRAERYISTLGAIVDTAPPVDQFGPDQRDRLAARIAEVVAAAPPLPEASKARLAAIINGGAR